MRRTGSVPFVVAASAGVATLTAASAPSPLYPVYQHLWGFSSLTLTLVFAVYVFALIAALLTVGSLSDLVGRRPVVSGALLLLALGMLLFASAGSTADLIVARIVQGFAVGAAAGATTAMITETAPTARSGSVMSSASSPLGIALGAVLSGLLVEYASSPRQLVFWVLGTIFLLLAVLVWTTPDTVTRSRASRAVIGREIVPRLGLSGAVRHEFTALVPSMVATWALAGLYLSLGASVVGEVFGVRNHFIVSLVLGAFFGAGIAGSAIQSTLASNVARWSGHAALAVGMLVTILATLGASLPMYVVGSVIAGAGFGATFRDVLAAIADAAPQAERGRTFASMYVVSYVAFSVPSLLAGVAVEFVGLRSTSVAYGALEVLLVSVAALTARRRTTITQADPR